MNRRIVGSHQADPCTVTRIDRSLLLVATFFIVPLVLPIAIALIADNLQRLGRSDYVQITVKQTTCTQLPVSETIQTLTPTKVNGKIVLVQHDSSTKYKCDLHYSSDGRDGLVLGVISDRPLKVGEVMSANEEFLRKGKP